MRYNNLGKFKRELTLNNLINIMLFLYILSIYLLTYRDGLNLVSNTLAYLLIASIWVNFLLSKRKRIVFNKFLIIYLLFIIICLISSLYAINQGVALTRVRTLLLLFVLMTSLVNYIDTFEKLRKFMIYFVYSGLIASVYILLTSDFSQATRFAGDLGNLNAIGMIIGVSSAFCFYFILEEKKYLYFPFLLTMLPVVLLTGSRKALLFILITFIIILISRDLKGLKNKINVLIIIIVIISLSYYLINNVTIFYEIIGRRMENLFDFVLGEDTNEGSINIRSVMISVGIDKFKERPILGYGIDNYKLLFSNYVGGEYTYSHNNFVELLVGTGILGAFTYYLTNIIVLKDLIKTSKNNKKTLSNTFLAIIIAYLFMSVGLVYYYNKHISILLAVGSIVFRLIQSEQVKSNKEN
jgi:O-antigen ligase